MSNKSIPIIFKNLTGQDAYVQFLNGHFGTGQTGANGTVNLAGDTAYSFTELSSEVPGHSSLGSVPNVSLNDFTNGRIYFNLGSAGLSNLGSGYQPSSSDSHDPNYSVRYGFIEPNVFGNSANNMDLSFIDFFGLSITASTFKDGKEVATLPCAYGCQIIDALAPLTNNNACIPEGAPTPPYTDFARILGPGHSSAYHDWTAYLNHLEGSPYTTQIAGYYGGDGSNSGPLVEGQDYSFTAAFSQADATVTLTGTCGLVGATTIVMTYADLNAVTGIYGANPPYTITNTNHGGSTVGIVNNVFGWVVGDLLAGLNFGYPGSSTPMPGTSNVFGQATSSEWFAATKADASLQFGGVQSNSDHYNQYAAALQPLAEAYGFSFTDRLGNILIPFGPDNVDYLVITLQSDAQPA